MNRQIIRHLVFVSLAVFASNCAWAIDVEEIHIGEETDPECFRFAIFADPQYDCSNPPTIDYLSDAVDEIITLNNDGNPDTDIRLVIVLGDLIQGEGVPFAWKGETEYRQEFDQVKSELERLQDPRPAGAGIHFIPEPGNHDAWFKWPDPVTGGYVHVDDPPDYPEELFQAYFSSKYDALSRDLLGWTKQEVMPPSNPYDPQFPAPYFQNFAFELGPYHSVHLDFCSRDDYDPMVVEGIPPELELKLKRFWGYADLHDFPNGTWQWLEAHLQWCQSAGITEVIVFTHHPPIYELDLHTGDPMKIRTAPLPHIHFTNPAEVKGEMHIVNDPSGQIPACTTLSNHREGPGFQSWDGQIIVDSTEVDRIEGDAVFAFNKDSYDCHTEYERFADLFSNYGINIVHWFSGHYHLKGFEEWTDTNINTDVTVVPSVMPASTIGGIEFNGSVTINEQADAVVTPQANPNGCIAIVHVHSDEGPDVFTRDHSADYGRVPSWDKNHNGIWDGPSIDYPYWTSPDIWVTEDVAGNVPLDNPIAESANYLWARVRNIGCVNAENIEVQFYWGAPDIGTEWPDHWYQDGIVPSSLTISSLPAGGEWSDHVTWTPVTEPQHQCIWVRLDCDTDPIVSDDPGWENNIGWKNFWVIELKKVIDVYGADVDFEVKNTFDSNKDISVQMYSPDLPVDWSAQLTSPHWLYPFDTVKGLYLEREQPGLTCNYTWSAMPPGKARRVTLSVRTPLGIGKDTATIHIAGAAAEVDVVKNNYPIGGGTYQIVFPKCETLIPGDMNKDCCVDFLDFVVIAQHWLEEVEQP